jgi:tRNA(Ile)-lysidine synthase
MYAKKVKKESAVDRFERVLAGEAKALGLFERRGLAAVSGGADSLALVLGLTRVGVDVVACCVDHGLRADSASEAQGVVTRLATQGIAAEVVRVQVEPGTGVEARARQARYAALESAQKRQHAVWVATGHTANDQAETVLFRLGRGSSLAGAQGVHRVRGALVRPLLPFARSDCEAYVQARGVSAVNDPMNVDTQFSRVRIRQQVLPGLVAITGPGTVQSLARFARHAAADEAYLAHEAAAALQRVADGRGLERVAFLALPSPVARRVLASWLAQQQVHIDDADVLDAALEAIGRAKSAPVSGQRLVTCKKGWVLVSHAPARLH